MAHSEPISSRLRSRSRRQQPMTESGELQHLQAESGCEGNEDNATDISEPTASPRAARRIRTAGGIADQLASASSSSKGHAQSGLNSRGRSLGTPTKKRPRRRWRTESWRRRMLVETAAPDDDSIGVYSPSDQGVPGNSQASDREAMLSLVTGGRPGQPSWPQSQSTTRFSATTRY